MIFPKDEGVGDWKSGEIRIGQSPTLGKTFFEFLVQENTTNNHFSLMWQRFTFPHNFGMEKRFWKPNYAFMQQKASKNDSESKPFMIFPCSAICSFTFLVFLCGLFFFTFSHIFHESDFVSLI